MGYGYKRKRTYKRRYSKRYGGYKRKRFGARRSAPKLSTTASALRRRRGARLAFLRGGGPPGSGVGKRKATWEEWGGHLKRAAVETYRMAREAAERSTNPMFMSFEEMRMAGLPIPGAPAPMIDTHPEPLIGF